ncbi:MAG: QueT transporter family protein [Clostridia bacterium]|nr:QueT transporter family protein [Clostridia bacterium]
MKKRVRFITYSAIIAALYVILTGLSAVLHLASGPIQIRLAEALTVLPVFTPTAIPGLFLGCVLANFLTGSLIWDVVFGSFATLIGAIGTYFLRKKSKYLAALPPIVSNMLIVPAVLQYVYGEEQVYWILMLTVGVGEILSAGVCGLILHKTLSKTKLFLN